MEKIKRDMHDKYPNMIPIRCCLHVLNLMIRDIASQNDAMLTKCKTLVNFFKYGQWGYKAQLWGKENKVVRLTTFCETRWYSLAKVCKGVAAYEEFFKRYGKSKDTAPALDKDLQDIMMDRQLYTDVANFVRVIDPFVSAIATLESDWSTCGDVLVEMLRIQVALEKVKTAKANDVAALKLVKFALDVLDDRSGEFNTDVHFIATYLNPLYKVHHFSIG
jgi:hypothetical protein